MESIKFIRELISKGEIETALTMLSSINSTYQNEVLLLSARYSLLNDKGIKGIISENDKSLEYNTIVHSLINLINKIENEQILINSTKKHIKLSKAFGNLNKNQATPSDVGDKVTLVGTEAINLIVYSSEVDVVCSGIHEDRDMKLVNELYDFLNLVRSEPLLRRSVSTSQNEQLPNLTINTDERKANLMNKLSKIVLTFSEQDIEYQFFEITDPTYKIFESYMFEKYKTRTPLLYLPLFLLNPIFAIETIFMLTMLSNKKSILIKLKKTK